MNDTNQMHKQFMLEAVKLSARSLESTDGGPFGCVIVKDGEIVGRGYNRVVAGHDPTAHAEIEAIRDACKNLGTHQLDGCTLYTSCEPCPMCLGAIYWARPDAVFYANTRHDAAGIGFDDAFIYEQIQLTDLERSIPTKQLPLTEALDIFNRWVSKIDRPEY
jgi:tRNA(Arg) A34 adenosine deaminase TadA